MGSSATVILADRERSWAPQLARVLDATLRYTRRQDHAGGAVPAAAGRS